MGGESPFDVGIIAEIEQLGDLPGFFAEMLSVFCEDIQRDLAEFEAHLDQRSVQAARAAHRMKAGSGNLGAVSLHRACARAEAAVRRADWDAAALLAREVRLHAAEAVQWAVGHLGAGTR